MSSRVLELFRSSHENRFVVPPLGGFLKSPTKVGTTNFSSLFLGVFG
jgi:hypothetical protein